MTSTSFSSTISAWLRLTRASALPSAVSNVLVGSLLADGTWAPTADLILLILGSCCLYASGMVLNDICDMQADAKLNPGRPLVTREISRRFAIYGYLCLSALGMILCVIVSATSLWIGIAIVVSIFLYDCVLKQTAFAPIFMGICRFLNIILGSTMSGSELPAQLFLYAIGIAVFIAGLTYFARNERQIIGPGNLNLSGILILTGILTLLFLPWVGTQTIWTRIVFMTVLVALVSMPLRLVLVAIRSLDPDSVQTAVVACLRSLILLDAAACYVANPNQILYPLFVAALIIPAKLLGRRISVT